MGARPDFEGSLQTVDDWLTPQARELIGRARDMIPRLVERALDRVGDQLVVALAPRLAAVDLPDDLTVLVEMVGVDARERAHAPGRGPSAGAFAVRDRNALAAFDDGQDLAARNQQGFQREQNAFPSLIASGGRLAAASVLP